MGTDQIAVVATFGAYILLMLAIGWFAWRQTHALSDYILGGRRLGPWVAALSAGASDMSGWLLLGLPGKAYTDGAAAAWIALGLLIGTYLNWRVLARRLRIYSQRANNALTLPEFFEERFADRSRVLRVISAAFTLLFFLFYTSAGLVAGGRLFEHVFGLDYVWAVSAGTAAIIVYTFFGGFLAVSWTDLVQGLLMAAALLVVPLAVVIASGGWGLTYGGIEAAGPALLNPFTTAEGGALSFMAVVSALGWGLGYFGQPHILARFQGIRGPGAVGAARRIAVSWTALTLLGALLVGVAGIGYVEPALTGDDTETVFLVLVQALFHPLIAGILLAAVLAAIMSTADSQLLVSSSALSEDFYKSVLRPQASPRELLLVGRAAVIGIAVVAFLMAMDPQSKVLKLVAHAWAGFGAAFGPALLLSLYWGRMNTAGALAGIVVGGVTVVVWIQTQGGIFDLYEIVPGFILSTVACVAATLLTPPPAPFIADRHRQVVVAERAA